jgi:hypothetical protein
VAKDIEGFVLVDKDARDILDKDGEQMQVGPATLEQWEEAAALGRTMMWSKCSLTRRGVLPAVEGTWLFKI